MQSRAPAVRPSELLRGQAANASGLVTGGNAWGARYRTSEQDNNQSQYQQLYSQSSSVDSGEPIRPSEAFKGDGDALAKYRIKDENEENGPVTSDSKWEIQLRNIPAGPVELFVSGKSVLSIDGTNNLTTTVNATTPSGTGDIPFLLRIPSAGFTFSRNLSAGNGTYIRFSVENTGMKFRQQKGKFTD